MGRRGHKRVELYLYSPLWAVRPVQSLSACTRVTFTLPILLCSLFFMVDKWKVSSYCEVCMEIFREGQ